MSQPIEPDSEQFLARLNAAVDAYIERMHGQRPQGTKTWIATQLRIDRTTLYKYLDGTNHIPLDTLRTLIRLVGLGDVEANTLLFLGGYGVPVPVVATPPPAEPVITPTSLRAALAEVLPGALSSALADPLSLFTGLLSDLGKGQLTREDLSHALADDPRLDEIMRALAGKQVRQADGALISFGAGTQTGDISVHDVAGRDIINVTINLPQPTSITPSSLYQLRAPVADFIGRAQEIADLTAALTSGGGATISGVAGMGGIGKTELAMKVGNDILERYPDAQIVLNLQGSRDSALLATQALQQVIRAFLPDAQLPDDAPSLAVAYRSVLTGKRVLILADDAKDATQVKPLLPPPGSALLITSRQRFTLGGMQRIDLERLSEDEAIALLRHICDRLTTADAQQIAAACGRLPLALRIAGGVLTNDETVRVARYLERLADEKRRLSALRDPDDPDLDVEASIALSYDLLGDGERTTLCHLGVFAASFDLAAAMSALDESDDEVVERRCGLLYRRSLVEFAQGRYDLHDLVRVFVLSKLGDEERPARLRHAQHYIAVAAQAEGQFLGGGDGITAGLAVFDREQANLDAARLWLQAHAGDTETDALLIADADATAHIGDLRYGKQRERIPQLETALAAATRLHRRDAQGRFLGNLGLAYAALGDARNAIDFYQQQLVIAREIGDRRGEGNALGNLGLAYAALGDARNAIDFYQQQLVIAREIGDRQGEGNALGSLGNAYFALGDARKAIDFYQQHLTIAREIGDRRGEGNTLGNLGNAYAALGDARKAIDFYQQRLVIVREIGDRQGEAETGWNYGLILVREGDAAQALPHMERSLAFHQEIGHPRAAMMAETVAFVRVHGTLPAQQPSPVGLPDDLPESVRQAIQSQDNAAFQAAMESLPDAERTAVFAKLQDAGIIGRGPDMSQVLREFTPLLRGIAAVANGDDGPRTAVEQALAQLEEGGWQITGAVQRIWAGERDNELLTESIDDNSAMLVRRILELIDAPAEATDTEGDAGNQIPESIQVAIASNDPAAIQTALEALPTEERTRVEGLIQQATQQAIARAQRRRPEEIIAGLPAAVRAALEQQDDAAFQVALTGLPDAERQRTLADLADLQTLNLLAAQEAQQRDPREQFAALLQAIAAIARGNVESRVEAVQALSQMEQGGWMLRGPVERIWAGERNNDVLTEGLDAQDTALVTRILALIDAPEETAEPAGDDRETVLNALPAPVRTAIQSSDATALHAALATMPHDEAQVIIEQLHQAGIIGSAPPSDRPRPDIDQVIQNFLPLLGDIALAAFGDEIARQLAEAVLPRLEEQGWRLSAAAQRIWVGERNMAVLTDGIDPNSAALVRRTLHMVEDGPGMIFVAESLQIAHLRRQADEATAQALASGDATQRVDLAGQLEQASDHAEQQSGVPWQELAAHLRALVAQLGDA